MHFLNRHSWRSLKFFGKPVLDFLRIVGKLHTGIHAERLIIYQLKERFDKVGKADVTLDGVTVYFKDRGHHITGFARLRSFRVGPSSVLYHFALMLLDIHQRTVCKRPLTGSQLLPLLDVGINSNRYSSIVIHIVD